MNYYEILGVEKNASADEIKKAYRQLVKKYHPDVNSAANANTFFNLIQDAYRVLSDEKLKRDYDIKNNYVREENNNNKANYESKVNSNKANYNNSKDYGFGEELSEEEINEMIRQQYGDRSIFTKILIVLLKILLAIFIPIISFFEHISTIGVGVIALVSKGIMIVFIGGTIMGLFEVHKGQADGWTTVIMSIIVAFVAFCIPYIIIMIPVVLGLLKDKISSFVFDRY